MTRPRSGRPSASRDQLLLRAGANGARTGRGFPGVPGQLHSHLCAATRPVRKVEAPFGHILHRVICIAILSALLFVVLNWIPPPCLKLRYFLFTLYNRERKVKLTASHKHTQTYLFLLARKHHQYLPIHFIFYAI